MKKLLFTLLTVAASFVGIAQTTTQTYDTTITAVIKDFSEACGEDAGDAVFCLTDEKGVALVGRYSCIYDNGNWQVEPKDLITSQWVINPSYKGKKATLYCMKSAGGAGWVVAKVEFATQTTTSTAVVKPTVDLTDSFPSATCRITNSKGELKGIVDGGVYYKIYTAGNKNSGKSIQNKNEYCLGTKCVRYTINAQGYIVKYFLPNVTDGMIIGKIEGTKMYACKKADGSDINRALYFTYTGNKQQAVNLIGIYDWFR